jgi:hypothetical protein
MLRDIQQQFLSALFNQEPSPNILSVISETGARTAQQQFMSYRDSVIGGMIEAMAISYPVVKKLVGAQFFNHITYQFIRQTPSISPDLNNYGGNFSHYLETLDNLETVPYLYDVARLEWHWQCLINGSNAKPGNLHLLVDVEDSQTDNLLFKLSPHSGLLTSDYAVHKIWELNQDDHNFSESIDIEERVNLFIWRNKLDMNITVINENQYLLLLLIEQNKIFSNVCVQYNAQYPDDDIGTLLSYCIQSGWIYSFSISQ